MYQDGRHDSSPKVMLEHLDQVMIDSWVYLVYRWDLHITNNGSTCIWGSQEVSWPSLCQCLRSVATLRGLHHTINICVEIECHWGDTLSLSSFRSLQTLPHVLALQFPPCFGCCKPDIKCCLILVNMHHGELLCNNDGYSTDVDVEKKKSDSYSTYLWCRSSCDTTGPHCSVLQRSRHCFFLCLLHRTFCFWPSRLLWLQLLYLLYLKKRTFSAFQW